MKKEESAERKMLVGFAMTGLISKHGYEMGPDAIVQRSIELADGVIARLKELDGANKKPKKRLTQQDIDAAQGRRRK